MGGWGGGYVDELKRKPAAPTCLHALVVENRAGVVGASAETVGVATEVCEREEVAQLVLVIAPVMHVSDSQIALSVLRPALWCHCDIIACTRDNARKGGAEGDGRGEGGERGTHVLFGMITAASKPLSFCCARACISMTEAVSEG